MPDELPAIDSHCKVGAELCIHEEPKSVEIKILPFVSFPVTAATNFPLPLLTMECQKPAGAVVMEKVTPKSVDLNIYPRAVFWLLETTYMY